MTPLRNDVEFDVSTAVRSEPRAVLAASVYDDVEFDVSGAMPGGSHAVLAASVVTPPDGTPVRRTVVFAVPGGTYTRSYWHLEEAVLPGYDCAQYLAQAGFVVIAVDHLGTGKSSRPASVEPTPELLAQALHVAASEARARITQGDLVAGLAPIDDVELVGIGHSMGACLTLLQQSCWQTYERIGAFGITALPPDVESMPLAGRIWDDDTLRESGVQEVPLSERIKESIKLIREQTGAGPEDHYIETNREALRPFFYGPFVSEDVIAADERLSTELIIAASAPGGTPGALTDLASAITVPVLLAFGEVDLAAAPRREPAAYSACDDITLVLLRGSAHCHNLSPARTTLWQRMIEWLG